MQTQHALYASIDLELSWSEAELPERERTKHVHRLHPYLGKFVPQLAETFLRRYAAPGQLVWDPFAGSGTTLVEANAFGARAAGCDVSAFNCLLMRVKTAAYEPAALLADVVRLASPHDRDPRDSGSPYLDRWFAPRSVAELLTFRERIAGTVYPDLWRVVLSRAARSARLARHDDLDFPREPVADAYVCHKHRRVCRPVGEAGKFLRRYVRDAAQRVRDFAEVRTDAEVTVVHGDARQLDPPAPVDLVLTSPPYPGLIDYHEQHAYAYELLGLDRRDGDEIGRSVKGYCDDIAAVLRRAARALCPGGKVVIVVNDSRALYDAILPAAGLRLEERLLRHVNRRTGRRNGEFYEEVLVATPMIPGR
ncbi:MAG TPA: DNA methyltransferase [Gaiellaceae bacterium]|nr:DNA methyltransferase [Gaiellaceae bacterium]